MAGIKAIDWVKGKVCKRRRAKYWEKKAESYKQAYRMKDVESDMWSTAVGQAFIRGMISEEAFHAIHNMHRDMVKTIHENLST